MNTQILILITEVELIFVPEMDDHTIRLGLRI